MFKEKHDASVVKPGLNSDYYENDRYNYVYDEDYDDEVFANLNS